MSIAVIIQSILILGFPSLALWLARKYSIAAFISPIVLCFAVGIIVANLRLLDVDTKAVSYIRDPAILLSLPLLLFSSDLKVWLRNSRKLLYGYFIAAFVTVFAVTFSAICFQHLIPEIWTSAGMMTGIHTGGTPNLFAVAMATDASDTDVTLIHSSQVLWGAIHLLFLLTVGHRLYEYFLGKADRSPLDFSSEDYVKHSEIKASELLYSLALASFLIALMAGLSKATTGELNETILIVGITSLAIVCSLHPSVRNWKGSFEAGDYLLLVFGVAAGMLTDMRRVISEGGVYISFVGIIFLTSIIFMLILSRLFGIKKDTAVISTTAAIYGPVFIPQVAQVLRNRSIIPGGIAVSLIGLALGNYMGILMASLLRSLLQ